MSENPYQSPGFDEAEPPVVAADVASLRQTARYHRGLTAVVPANVIAGGFLECPRRT